ncbi:complement component C1q receptor [Eublepharis macularius]|uniref:Complement component C1q receptor n=1 Tax=Eublepharis macularius TaxID=481883 RepID=A0AA97L4X9_EUBMA|nr:complement component C1q receptor [Eublepharis macularius]
MGRALCAPLLFSVKMAILLQIFWHGLLSGLAVQPGQATEALCSGSTCYTLHWEKFSWMEAQKKCQNDGGNLATLKSPEEALLVRQLLTAMPRLEASSEVEVRLWIGLQREKGKCYQKHQPLKGFSWVAGEPETEYSNWVQEPRETCTAHRCVTLQGSPFLPEGLAWADGHCSRSVQGGPGYLCKFNFPGMCRPLALAGPGAVKYTTPFGVVTTPLLAVPFGSSADVACGPQGAEVADTFLMCRMQANSNTFEWSGQGPLCASPSHGCSYSNGGCEHQCLELGGGLFQCACYSGYQLGGDRLSCITVDYCSSNPCQGQCVPRTGGFDCLCSPGYALAADGRNCVDVDECSALQSPCKQICINTGGSFKCLCNLGYKLAEADGQTCQDIDECARDTPCAQLCANTHGSFLCSCEPGYQLEGINSASCLDVDECQEEPCEQMCKNLPGSYQCFCRPGWRLEPNGISCVSDATGSTSSPPTQGEVGSPTGVRPGSDPLRLPSDSPIQAESERVSVSQGTTFQPGLLSRPADVKVQAGEASAEKNAGSSKRFLYYTVGGVAAILLLLACVLILVTYRKMKLKKTKNEVKSAADNYSWVPDQGEARARSNEYM